MTDLQNTVTRQMDAATRRFFHACVAEARTDGGHTRKLKRRREDMELAELDVAVQEKRLKAQETRLKTHQSRMQTQQARMQAQKLASETAMSNIATESACQTSKLKMMLRKEQAIADTILLRASVCTSQRVKETMERDSHIASRALTYMCEAFPVRNRSN